MDFVNESYFTQICSAYIATFLCGISVRNLEWNDHTPKQITLIARYHLYYTMIKFIKNPELMKAYDLSGMKGYLPVSIQSFNGASHGGGTYLRLVGGFGKGERAAFRECFSCLSELRSLGPQRPLAPVLALTATATKKIQETVLQVLSFRQDYALIEETPNRTNIYLSKAQIGKNLKLAFQFLLDKLKKEKQDMERTIVYCKSIKLCASLYSLFRIELGSDAYPIDMEPNLKIVCLECFTIAQEK
ncbi:Hypothetical predicted protein [Paramuricea clavata]|uniref:Uncharacterized protein n=1 Tax=Paramuricea clavata TaxID=317549 RepID=A0A7D9HCN5_PARCT|nr:Hypothetical predicted protein [Paramuricea clavata]